MIFMMIQKIKQTVTKWYITACLVVGFLYDFDFVKNVPIIMIHT
jgi:hypothetical protein